MASSEVQILMKSMERQWGEGVFSNEVGTLNYKPVKVKVAQSCPTLCDPMDYRVHRILQARILEWVAFPFSPGDFLNPGYKKHTLKIRAGKIENKRIEKYKPCKW